MARSSGSGFRPAPWPRLGPVAGPGCRVGSAAPVPPSVWRPRAPMPESGAVCVLPVGAGCHAGSGWPGTRLPASALRGGGTLIAGAMALVIGSPIPLSSRGPQLHLRHWARPTHYELPRSPTANACLSLLAVQVVAALLLLVPAYPAQLRSTRFSSCSVSRFSKPRFVIEPYYCLFPVTTTGGCDGAVP
jgi:hypothetical protein